MGALASLKGKETHRTAHAFSFFAKRARVWPLTLRTSCSFDRPRVLGCIARKSSSKLSTRAERTNERQGEREQGEREQGKTATSAACGETTLPCHFQYLDITCGRALSSTHAGSVRFVRWMHKIENRVCFAFENSGKYVV